MYCYLFPWLFLAVAQEMTRRLIFHKSSYTREWSGEAFETFETRLKFLSRRNFRDISLRRRVPHLFSNASLVTFVHAPDTIGFWPSSSHKGRWGRNHNGCYVNCYYLRYCFIIIFITSRLWGFRDTILHLPSYRIRQRISWLWEEWTEHSLWSQRVG